MHRRHTDLSTLHHLFKGERAGMEQWIQLYLEEAPAYFHRVAACLANGDVAGLCAAVHELRPQAHYLGASRMLELLLSIGQCAPAEGASACASKVDELLQLGRSGKRWGATVDRSWRHGMVDP